jgi:hypothetical protein
MKSSYQALCTKAIAGPQSESPREGLYQPGYVENELRHAGILSRYTLAAEPDDHS